MKGGERLIVSIAGRITLFLYLFTVLILVLYILGSFQDFIDDSLIKLLFTFKFSSLVYIAFALSYLFILPVAGRNQDRNTGLRLFATLMGIILTTFLFLMVEIIITGIEPVL